MFSMRVLSVTLLAFLVHLSMDGSAQPAHAVAFVVITEMCNVSKRGASLWGNIRVI